jgi:hypothetical protein
LVASHAALRNIGDCVNKSIRSTVAVEGRWETSDFANTNRLQPVGIALLQLVGWVSRIGFRISANPVQTARLYWFPERNPFEGVPHQIFLRTSLMLGHCNSVLTLL